MIGSSGSHRAPTRAWVAAAALLLCACGLSACGRPGGTVAGPEAEARRPVLQAREREALEVALFNDYGARASEWADRPASTQHVRGKRVRAIAQRGLEIAELADELLDFDHRGHPRPVERAKPAWDRLRVLAETGDAGAQCFFAQLAENVGPMQPPSLSPATQHDLTVLAPLFLQKAARQGQSLCLYLWSARNYSDGDPRYLTVLQETARKGCAECQVALYMAYRNGRGTTRDDSLALCWIQEATIGADAPGYQTLADIIVSEYEFKRHYNEPHQPLRRFRPGAGCTEPLPAGR